jgi:colanic acid/amylovoran biosynthesis glycosyltransferase
VIKEKGFEGRSIAYLAAILPAASETFVYREIRELRRRGWAVHAVSLNRPANATGSGAPDPLADIRRDLIILYGPSARGTFMEAMKEGVRHPMRSGSTLFKALLDAIRPGEPLGLAGRLKLVPQAIASLGLARKLRPRGVQHIHCHFAHAPATIGMYASHHLGIPFSFTGHANDLFQRRALLKRKLQRAQFVACISRWHRDFYVEVEMLHSAKYAVIRCGVDVAEWRPRAPDFISGPSLQVLTVCRLVEKKGTDTLIEALHEFGLRSGNRWELTVAGDGPERERLHALARRLECEDSIRWLGSVENSEVRELLGDADVLALPCRTDSSGDRDGIPVVLMEAMARGVPVVAGDLPAIRELIDGQNGGLLVPGAEPAKLAGALAALHGNSELRRRLSIGGREVIEREFSLAANVTLLEGLLAGRREEDELRGRPYDRRPGPSL